MIFFDVTKVSGHQHKSGITRVSRCLRHELSRLARNGLTEVAWSERHGSFVGAATGALLPTHLDDWLLTPELFSEDERPGFSAWLATRPCRTAAIYHDSIPLLYPEFTWPHSVTRHPHYLKTLSRFDLVIANSKASAREVMGYWEWLGVPMPDLISVPLGANGALPGRREIPDPAHLRRRTVLMIGILEPRKNQEALLDAAETLWAEGQAFALTFVGRVNPHFGRPLAERIRALERSGQMVRHVAQIDDAEVARLLAQTRFSVLPSLAEGCGLPLMESLWAGVPGLCSDIAPLLETATLGGCRVVRTGDTAALTVAMRELLADDVMITRLAAEACASQLPTWADTARAILAAM